MLAGRRWRVILNDRRLGAANVSRFAAAGRAFAWGERAVRRRSPGALDMPWIALLALIALIATAAAVLAVPVSPPVHIAATAASSFVLAAAAIYENRRLRAAGASGNALSSATAATMGAVWAWGGLSVFLIYAFGLASWPEWWQFPIAFAALAGLCVLFAVMMARDEEAGREDQTMLTLAWRLTAAQLAGSIAAMAGLLIDGKMTRFFGVRKGWEDWPANNVFFFGALALALVSANALWTSRDANSNPSRAHD